MASGIGEARAHAFGQRYDLPLPLDLYLAGAAAAVVLSFVVMAVAFRERPRQSEAPWADLAGPKARSGRLHRAVTGTLKAAAVGLFLLVVAAGFLGNQETVKNFAPTFVWIIWWVGFAYLAALVGNPWPVLNPFSILFSWAEWAWARAAPGRRFGLDLPYPEPLGAWPAVLLFVGFAWFELLSPAATSPAVLALAIVAYGALTWFGMFAFGHRIWLVHGEAFARAFDVFGRFAPLGGPALDDPASGDGRPHLYLRPYAGALVADRPARLSVTAFVVLMLSTVTFDGFKETPLWGALLQGTAASPTLHPAIRGIHDLGFDLQSVLETALFVLFPLVFFIVYLGFAGLTRRWAGDDRPLTEIAGLFVYSLVPIAIAYHLAHYLSYLVLAGQLIIPLASDPFGWGWDLFGTAGHRIRIDLIGAKFVWYAAVISIVAGHVIAVGVGHFTALRAFPSPLAARRSQYPMLVLMVGYTVASLWILSQPIVGGGDVGTLRAARDTVTLAPFEFRERCYALRAGETLAYDFSADRPVDFDIHYHDGLRTHAPVALSGATNRGGRFRAASNRTYCLMWANRNLAPASVSYRIQGPR
ncbi:MAG: hypothetical protein R3229_04120 [Alphaproteobacteria bacterium]|nr:hypothetical protein [Alphaproteobacteria bacterium]